MLCVDIVSNHSQGPQTTVVRSVWSQASVILNNIRTMLLDQLFPRHSRHAAAEPFTMSGLARGHSSRSGFFFRMALVNRESWPHARKTAKCGPLQERERLLARVYGSKRCSCHPWPAHLRAGVYFLWSREEKADTAFLALDLRVMLLQLDFRGRFTTSRPRKKCFAAGAVSIASWMTAACSAEAGADWIRTADMAPPRRGWNSRARSPSPSFLLPRSRVA